MAEDKLREAALKPIATIKKPVIAAEKKDEGKPAEAEVPKAEEKKATAAKKPAAKKTTAAKAPATKTNIVLQYADKSVTYDTFIENAKNVWQYDMGRKVSEIKTLELYVKPEEERVYFVVNGEVHADFGM